MRAQKRETKNHRQDGQQQQTPDASLRQPARGLLQKSPRQHEND
jgi:hypothetical protein